jgi:hypothetical protein
LQQQSQLIAENRQCRLNSTTPEVTTLQKELDDNVTRTSSSSSSHDCLGVFQQRAHLLRRIEILDQKHTQAEFRRTAREGREQTAEDDEETAEDSCTEDASSDETTPTRMKPLMISLVN